MENKNDSFLHVSDGPFFVQTRLLYIILSPTTYHFRILAYKSMLSWTNSFSYSISNIGIEHTCIKIFWSVKEELWLKIKSFEASFIFSSGKSFKGLILSPICVKTSSPDTNLTNFSGKDTFFLINSEVFVFLKRKINIIYLFFCERN